MTADGCGDEIRSNSTSRESDHGDSSSWEASQSKRVATSTWYRGRDSKPAHLAVEEWLRPRESGRGRCIRTSVKRAGARHQLLVANRETLSWPGGSQLGEGSDGGAYSSQNSESERGRSERY